MSYQIWEPQFEPPAPEGQPGPAGRVVAGTVGETSAAGDDGMGLLPGASQAAGSGASDAAGSGYGVTALFRAHHAELIRLAALMTGDRASGEDIVQDVFARLCARDRLPDPDGALAYVRAAVLNGCRSALRRRAVARRFGISHGTVKSTAARGIAALARQLGEPA